MGPYGDKEKVEQVSGLAAAGIDRRQHPLDEATAGRRFGTEAGLGPAHSVTQGSFGGVVRRPSALVLALR